MDNLKSFKVFLSAIAAIMALMLVLQVGPACAASAWKPPKVIQAVTTDIGTGHFQMATALASSVNETTGGKVKARIQPEGKGISRIDILRKKRVHFALEIGGTSYDAAQGLRIFEKDGWGPQRLRGIRYVYRVAMGFMTRRDAGIKTFADLVGKRVCTYKTYPVLDLYGYQAMMAYANLRPDQVKEVPVGGYKEGLRAVIDGAADTSCASPISPPVKELDASPHGLHWLQMPRSETEAWKRYLKVAPMMFPVTQTFGPGITKDRPQHTFGYCYRWNVYDWQDENLVYWFTKKLDTMYDDYKERHPLLKFWTTDIAINLEQAFYPFHPGAVKYYKEIGMWGPKEDKWQAEMLAKEVETITAWQKKHPGWKIK